MIWKFNGDRWACAHAHRSCVHNWNIFQRPYLHYRDGHDPVTRRSRSGHGPGAFTCPLRSRSTHGPIISYTSIPPLAVWMYDLHWGRMCYFSPAELAVIAIALDDEERKQSRKRKGVWVHPILQEKKKSEGEFHTLFPRLIDDESKFHCYFRMNIGTFEKILSKI